MRRSTKRRTKEIVYLTAALILVGCLCALDLLLTVGVIRRLREHSETLATLTELQKPDDTLLRPGTLVPDLSIVTSDGTDFALRSLARAPFLVAFFSADCDACREQLPSVERYAGSFPGGRSAVLAVLTGDSDRHGDLEARLQAVAQVVIEREDAPLTTGFSVNIWPAYVLVGRNGAVEAVGHVVEELPTPSPVSAFSSATG